MLINMNNWFRLPRRGSYSIRGGGNMEKGIRIVNREGKRVVEGIGYYEPAKISDLKQIVKDSAKKYGDAKAFLFKDKQ